MNGRQETRLPQLSATRGRDITRAVAVLTEAVRAAAHTDALDTARSVPP
jgi:hypothetical protein